MGRLGLLVLAAALGGAALCACHEQFDALDAPDLAKRPETFGFDLAVTTPPDMASDLSAEVHPDMSKLDAN